MDLRCELVKSGVVVRVVTGITKLSEAPLPLTLWFISDAPLPLIFIKDAPLPFVIFDVEAVEKEGLSPLYWKEGLF